jgi:hypothetical protein
MNKPLKLVTIASLISLAFLILIVFIEDIRVADIPLWAIIGIPTLHLAIPLIFFLVQRSTQRTMQDASLQKQRKRALIVFGSYAIFMLMLFLIIYHTKPQSLQTILLPQLVWLPTLFFINFRLFFPKEKEPTEDDNQDN